MAAAGALTADTIAALLADSATRINTIDKLEAHSGAHDESLALAAIVQLSELMALDQSEVEPPLFRRIGWLRGRLVAESADPAVMYGAAERFGGLMEKVLGSTTNALGRLTRKVPEEIAQEDVLTCAAVAAIVPPACPHGITPMHTAAAGDSFKWLGSIINRWSR